MKRTEPNLYLAHILMMSEYNVYLILYVFAVILINNIVVFVVVVFFFEPTIDNM